MLMRLTMRGDLCGGGGPCVAGATVAAVEKVDGFEFLAQLCLLVVGDVLERSAVRPEVEADELHDTLAAHDVAAEVANDVDDVLCIVL